ncbi:MAG: hypothetical protein Q9220_000236 [cf. Caloplaca sp. 1 TL-2023]
MVSESQKAAEVPLSTGLLRDKGGVPNEQVNSDLEDGELSEGADDGSYQPQLSRRSSLKASDGNFSVKHDDGQRQPAPACLYTDHGGDGNNDIRRVDTNGKGRARPQQNSRLLSATHHVNSDPTGSASATPRNGEYKKSLQTSRDGARRAIEQLQLHGIRYSQLLDEHIDPELLGKLYRELEIDTIGSTQAVTNPTKHKLQAASITALSNQNANSPKPKTKNFVPNSSMGEAADMTPKHQHTRDTAQVSSKSTTGIQLQHRSDQGQASSQLADPKGVAAKSPKQTADQGKREPATVETNTTTTQPSNNTNEIKSARVQIEPPKLRQSSVANLPSKPPTSKADVKTMDRKDYIARLLAAKAGKAPSVANAPKPPVDTTAHKVPQDSSPGTKNPAVAVSKTIIKPASTQHSLEDSSLSEVSPNLPYTANAAAEAKKREQTELARRKIEELKERAKVAKEISAANSEASASTVAEHSFPSQHSTAKPSTLILSGLIDSPSILSTPEGSYFPLESATFTIPGLFRSSSHSKPETHEEQSPTKLIGMSPSSLKHPTPNLNNTSTPATTSDQPDLTGESFAPPTRRTERSDIVSSAAAVQTGAVINPRKRPVAADFIEPVPYKVRRYPATEGDSSVVFEISDDEAAGSEDDDSDEQMAHDQGAKAVSAGDFLTSGTKSSPNISSNQDLPRRSSLGKMEQTSNTVNVNNLGFLTPVKAKDSSGLRSKEEEIERMNRKIAEMEQRRKARQVASRAQTPGTPGAITTLLKSTGDHSTDIDQGEPDAVGHLPERTTQAADDSAMLGDETHEPLAQQSIELTTETPTIPLAIEETALKKEEEQRQLRKAEIESRLPSMGLNLDNFLVRLQSIEKEGADLKAQIQEQIDSKLRLEKELEELKKIPSSNATFPRLVENDQTLLRFATEGHKVHETAQWLSDPTPQLPGSKGNDRQPPDELLINKQRSPSLADRHMSHEPNPEESNRESSSSFDAPTDQSMINGELAEDVMDISGSESGDAVPEDKPALQVDAATPARESDDEELYEPPPSFGVVEQDSVVPTDLTQTPGDGREMQQDSVPKARHRTPPSEGTVVVTMQSATEDVASAASAPSYDPPSADMSDSDGYEPPEPIASVDTTPLTRSAIVPISQSLPAVVTTNRDAMVNEFQATVPGPPSRDHNQADQSSALRALDDPDQSIKVPDRDQHAHFTPYESPLQQFHAYRYHPDFISKVGNGYRSLTYSHNIDARKPICPYEIGGRCNDASCEDQHFKSMNLSDDMILVQMGAIPQGLSEEQRNAFVVGLRQIIQEIRGRKVKDFKTVASEIAAYRARFLGDSFKILPL